MTSPLPPRARAVLAWWASALTAKEHAGVPPLPDFVGESAGRAQRAETAAHRAYATDLPGCGGRTPPFEPGLDPVVFGPQDVLPGTAGAFSALYWCHRCGAGSAEPGARCWCCADGEAR